MKVIDTLLHPWYRLLILCTIGVILLSTSGSGGYIEQSTTQDAVGITCFIIGILTIPAQWLVEWIATR